MSLNKSCLGCQIQCTIDNEDYANTGAIGLLYTAFAANSFCTNFTSFVATQNDLPVANTLPNGQLTFIDENKVFVVQNNGEWEGFDGRQIFPKNVGVVWGKNDLGQLGTGTNIAASVPTGIYGVNNKWCSISAGQSHTTAIKTDGTLWAWGLNGAGQLGTNNTSNASTPTTTSDQGTNWCQVSAGTNHTAAVKTNGTLWTWGSNGQGRLGNNSILERCSPGTTSGGGLNWSQVEAGGSFTAGIKSDGTLWTWGSNDNGALGNGSTVDRSSPGTTAGGGSTWCQISASEHASAIKTDGTLWTWGYNSFGQLGDGTTTVRSSPDTVAGGGTTWCQVNSGALHTSAIKTDGTIWTWGNNNNGRLGDGTTSDRCSPDTVAGGGTTWCCVSSGISFTSAIKTDGTMWTWGASGTGQLGNGTTSDRCSPGTTILGGTTWTRVSSGGGHTIATTNPA